MAWTPEDAQRFSDGNVLRASTIPAGRPGGPAADEWDDQDWVEDDEPLTCGIENPESCESCT